MTAAHWFILAAAAVAAVGWVLWARHRPRIRRAKADECQCGPFPCIGDWPDTDGRVRATDEGAWQDQALGVVAEHCCDLHNRNCEPPSELCCRDCTEVEHPLHWTTDCIAPDLSAGLDVIAEPDHRRAEHMNRTLRLAEGGDET